MREKFIAYLQEPTLENFLPLREAVMAAEGFDPYSCELDGIPAMMDAGDFKGVAEKITDELWPNHFLSPGAHLDLGFAHHKLGQKEQSEMERTIASLLLHGIEQTGEGTREKPFLVARTSDEYDYLNAHRLTMNQQALVEYNERNFDILTTEERGDIWFDITEVKQILERQFKEG